MKYKIFKDEKHHINLDAVQDRCLATKEGEVAVSITRSEAHDFFVQGGTVAGQVPDMLLSRSQAELLYVALKNMLEREELSRYTFFVEAS